MVQLWCNYGTIIMQLRYIYGTIIMQLRYIYGTIIMQLRYIYGTGTRAHFCRSLTLCRRYFIVSP